MNTPAKPQFSYIKVGCKGYSLYAHVSMIHVLLPVSVFFSPAMCLDNIYLCLGSCEPTLREIAEHSVYKHNMFYLYLTFCNFISLILYS